MLFKFLKLFVYMQIVLRRRLGEGCSRSAHFSIAHYDVPPLGINLHQGWGVRSVIEIGVVLWLWTGKSLCSVIQRALGIHRSNICGDFTLRYASENNFANLRSGKVFFRIIVIFEACGEVTRSCQLDARWLQVTFFVNYCLIRSHSLKPTHCRSAGRQATNTHTLNSWERHFDQSLTAAMLDHHVQMSVFIACE